MATFTGSTGNDSISAAAGSLGTFTGGSVAQLQDTIGDTFIGNAGNDTMRAGAGDDVLLGGDGSDRLFGGLGNDQLFGGSGDDRLVLLDGEAQRFDGQTKVLGGGGGEDTLSLQTSDDRGDFFLGDDTIQSIERIELAGNGGVTIDFFLRLELEQFGGNGIASDAIFIGSGSALYDIDVNMTASGNADFSALRFDGITDDGSLEVAGSSFNDTIAGTLLGDELFGRDGDDSVSGGDGDDDVSGGGGDDLLIGGSGANQVLGGNGNDTVGVSADEVPSDWDGGAGRDLLDFSGVPGIGRIDFNMETGDLDEFLQAAIAFEDAVLSDGDDSVSGNDADNSIDGGAGDDTLAGGIGADTLAGGAGADRLLGGSGDDRLVILEGEAEPGDDLAESLAGGSDVDTLSVQVADDLGRFFLGDDTILSIERVELTGNAGVTTDVLLRLSAEQFAPGGFASDVIFIGTGAEKYDIDVKMTAAGVADFSALRFEGITEKESFQVDGSGSDDTIVGTVLGDDLFGQSGDDSIAGGDGDDAVRGQLGNDTIGGDAGNDLLEGDDGDDLLIGGIGADTLVGGAGDDSLSGGINGNTLFGNSGEDTVFGVGSGFVADGGADLDTLDMRGLGLDFEWNMVTGESSFSNQTAVNFEVALMGSGNDSISGTGQTNTIVSGLGNDTVNGGSGRDLINGNEGNDLLQGGSQSDTIAGGDGNDTIFAMLARLVNGSTAGDRIDGGSGRDVLTGSTGQDTITGGSSRDVIAGSTGNDLLSGDSGADTIGGGGGNDTITGGNGRDVMTGGAGGDVFDYNAPGESGVTPTGRDVVTDFSPGSLSTVIDRIDLSGIDAIAGGSDDPFSFITGGFTGVGQVRVIQSGANALVQVNAAATPGLEMTILLQGVTASSINAGDFIL